MAHNNDNYKQNLQHFEGINPDNDTIFHKLSPEERDVHNTFVSRANKFYADARLKGIPAYAQSYIDEVKKVALSENRTNAPINYEAIYSLRSAYGETIYDSDISALIGVPSYTLPVPKWEIKDYLLGSFGWPVFTRKFRVKKYTTLKESSQFNRGLGMALGMSMSFTELAESGGALWSPQAVLQGLNAQKFGLHKSRRFFLGGGIWNACQDDGEDAADLGITGLFNDANLQTAQFGAGDEDVTADGDIEYGLETALADLDKVYAPHKKVLISTRGYAVESMLAAHRDGYTGVTDFERILQKFFDTGIISDWIVTDQISKGAAVTPAVAEQRAGIFCIGEATVAEHVIYPVQTLPVNTKMYDGDLAEMTIFANTIAFNKADTTDNAFPGTVCTGVITSTGTGAWFPQGRLDIGRWRAALHSANK
jgi:hypothetical protein